MNNWIGPIVKQQWNYAVHVMHKFFWFNINKIASDTAFISYYQRAPWFRSYKWPPIESILNLTFAYRVCNQSNYLANWLRYNHIVFPGHIPT